MAKTPSICARNQIARGTLLVLLGCSAGVQRPAIDTALKNSSMRHESFEAMLRVLDEHPEYAPEFLEVALHHESALEAILDGATCKTKDSRGALPTTWRSTRKG